LLAFAIHAEKKRTNKWELGTTGNTSSLGHGKKRKENKEIIKNSQNTVLVITLINTVMDNFKLKESYNGNKLIGLLRRGRSTFELL
jgi:hypothetical protein